MKIAMFGQKQLNRMGGVELVASTLCIKMAALGHTIVCYNRKIPYIDNDRTLVGKIEHNNKNARIKIRTVPTINRKGLSAVTASFFAAVCSAFSNCDVVHIHAEGPAAFCLIPKLFGKKVICQNHGLDYKRSEKWNKFAQSFILFGEKQSVKHADHIIVLSKSIQKYFWDTYQRKTVLIPNGIDKPIVREADQIRKIFNLEKNQYILFLGRLVPEKGIHYLIDAFKRINTDKKLVIAGDSSDTDGYVKELKDKSSDNANILFTGFVQGELLDELYSNAYVYVLPSDLEGMPMSLLEAMSYGNCCLVSDISENTDVVEKKAVSFKKGSIDDLREKLQMLCDTESIVEKYKCEASEYICARFNWDTIVQKILKLYEGR